MSLIGAGDFAGLATVDTDLRETPTSPYAITNVRAGASLGRMRMAVGVANLFNRTYVEHLSYQRDPFRTGTKVYELTSGCLRRTYWQAFS